MPRAAVLSVLALVARDATTDAATTVRAHLDRPGRGVQVRLAPITVAPASEREVCQAVALRRRARLPVQLTRAT